MISARVVFAARLDDASTLYLLRRFAPRPREAGAGDTHVLSALARVFVQPETRARAGLVSDASGRMGSIREQFSRLAHASMCL